MKSVAITEAKRLLPQLIAAVEEGEIVVITRWGKPIARIVRETPNAAAEEAGA